MVDLVSKHCACGTQMTFGEPGDAMPSACAKCKTPTMVQMRSAMCACGTHASFGEPGDQRPSACSKCKTPTMVILYAKLCGCGTQMTFGEPGDAQASACAKCKTPTMVNLVSKHCACGHQMTFGEPGDAMPSACAACKTPTMVQMRSAMCACGTQASFGEPGDKRASSCKQCKTPTMVDLLSNHCPCGHGFAFYEDAGGNKKSLCRSCAVAEGAHPERVVGASLEACRFFCMLKRMAPETHGYVPHVHWNKVSGEWDSFQEVKGLVPGRQIRPDGFLPDASGATKGTVYLFHGNRWHGYPPDHPKHGGEQVFRSARTGIERRVKNADLYAKTEADSKAYLAAGYKVVEMWEHDFKEVEKNKDGLLMSKLVRRAP
jgi:hypothetical protein